MTNAVQSRRTISDCDTILAWEEYETRAAAAQRQYQASPSMFTYPRVRENATRTLHTMAADGVCVECARRAAWS